MDGWTESCTQVKTRQAFTDTTCNNSNSTWFFAVCERERGFIPIALHAGILCGSVVLGVIGQVDMCCVCSFHVHST